MDCLEEVFSLDEHHQKTSSLFCFDNMIMSKQSNANTKKVSPPYLSLESNTLVQQLFGSPPLCMHLLAELLEVLAAMCLWESHLLSDLQRCIVILERKVVMRHTVLH